MVSKSNYLLIRKLGSDFKYSWYKNIHMVFIKCGKDKNIE